MFSFSFLSVPTRSHATARYGRFDGWTSVRFITPNRGRSAMLFATVRAANQPPAKRPTRYFGCAAAAKRRPRLPKRSRSVPLACIVSFQTPIRRKQSRNPTNTDCLTHARLQRRAFFFAENRANRARSCIAHTNNNRIKSHAKLDDRTNHSGCLYYRGNCARQGPSGVPHVGFWASRL